MPNINIAIVGIGNCASSLVEGIYYYRVNYNESSPLPPGLMNWRIGDYTISDIVPVAAFDVDRRKVGTNITTAIFSEPNNSCQIYKDKFFTDYLPNVIVQKGPVLDGVASHMSSHFIVDKNQPELTKDEIISILKERHADIIINYLPVGSTQATEFWANISLEAGCAFLNCIPVFIASDPIWADKFKNAKLPIIGDDVKSQLGATILHRTLAQLFVNRGVKLDKTYQLNVGGNCDFANMLDRNRLSSKKISKTDAVQSILEQNEQKLSEDNIHIGPSDYVPFLKDNKVCYLRMEGKIFGDVPIDLEIRLSVEDSPNSAGIVVDAIRILKLALDRKIAGPLLGPSAWLMKHGPFQYPDNLAHNLTEHFIHVGENLGTYDTNLINIYF